jgi:hypothetical protein
MPANGLIGYWPFDGDTKDKSGNGHDAFNATQKPVKYTSDKSGNPNAAFLCDSTFLMVPYSDAFNIAPTGELTVSLWLYYPSSGGFFGDLFTKGKVNYSSGGHIGNWSIKNDYGFALYDTPNYYVQPGNSNHFGQFKFSLNWFLMTYVYKNNQMSMYVNAKRDSTFQLSITQSTDSLMIANMTLYRKGGKVDELLFYNRAWTEAEIATYYSGIVTSIPTYSSGEASLQIVPNPSSTGSISIQSPESIEKIEVFDPLGNFCRSTSSSVLDGFTPGVYLLNIHTAKGVEKRKAIVQ